MKEVSLNIRITARLSEAIKERAEACGLSASEFIRATMSREIFGADTAEYASVEFMVMDKDGAWKSGKKMITPEEDARLETHYFVKSCVKQAEAILSVAKETVVLLSDNEKEADTTDRMLTTLGEYYHEPTHDMLRLIHKGAAFFPNREKFFKKREKELGYVEHRERIIEREWRLGLIGELSKVLAVPHPIEWWKEHCPF
jgi:hypothetical protein